MVAKIKVVLFPLSHLKVTYAEILTCTGNYYIRVKVPFLAEPGTLFLTYL